MLTMHPLAGVYAAAVTPLKPDLTPDLDAIPHLLQFLAARGCHGALLFGTTGEGPSFSPRERAAVWRAAGAARMQLPDFRLLAGTGTPSLNETIELTQLAFELDFDAVVVLPPYYFRSAPDDGLFRWFSELITRAVPKDQYLLGYHFPGTAGIGLSLDLLARLKDAFPKQFAGIKDSSGDQGFATELGKRFGPDLAVFSGTDSLLHFALQNKAQGAITAPANLLSVGLRAVWDQFNAGADPAQAQATISSQREVLERFLPYPSVLKALMHKLHAFPRWSVKPPLTDMPDSRLQQALNDFSLVYTA